MHTAEMDAVSTQEERDEERLSLAPERPVLTRTRIAVLVAIGGAAGAEARWGLEQLLPSVTTQTLVQLPWATLVANVIGCIVLGSLTGLIEVRPSMPRWAQPLLGTGFCGGFTTMSALILQFAAMLGADLPLESLGYGFGTAIAAVLATVLGLLLGRRAGQRLGPPRPVDPGSFPARLGAGAARLRARTHRRPGRGR